VPHLLYRLLVPVLWLAWLVYWRISAADVKPTERRESPGSRAIHVVPLLLAGVLLGVPPLPNGGWLFERFIPRSAVGFWIGVLLTAAGLGFSSWARTHLGRNWSGTVTVKHDHELIQSGPYRLVRHPIYSGILLAIIGTALVRGQWRGLVALAIVMAALWRKLRLEERWMSERFGEQYLRYRARTAAVIPFLL